MEILDQMIKDANDQLEFVEFVKMGFDRNWTYMDEAQSINAASFSMKAADVREFNEILRAFRNSVASFLNQKIVFNTRIETVDGHFCQMALDIRFAERYVISVKTTPIQIQTCLNFMCHGIFKNNDFVDEFVRFCHHPKDNTLVETFHGE